VTHLEFDLHLVAARDGDRFVCRAEGGDRDDDEVGACGHLIEPERAIRGHRGADAEFRDACHGEHNSLAVGFDAAGDGAGLLSAGCQWGEKEGEGAENGARHRLTRVGAAPRQRGMRRLGLVREHDGEFLVRSVLVDGCGSLAAASAASGAHRIAGGCDLRRRGVSLG